MQLTTVKKYILVIVILLVVIGGGIFFLSLSGKQLIREVVQEVVVEEESIMEFGLAIGKNAPLFTLTNTKGDTVTLSDFLGKPFILTFWTTWNPIAADQIQVFDSYLRKDSRDLFEVVTVSNQEDKSVVANFIQRGGYEVLVLLDESCAIGEIYQARNLPLTYFIDKEGIVRDIFVGVLSGEMLEQKAETILR